MIFYVFCLKVSAPVIHEFLTLLAVCHTVVPERDPEDGSLHYQASSPGRQYSHAVSDVTCVIQPCLCYQCIFYVMKYRRALTGFSDISLRCSNKNSSLVTCDTGSKLQLKLRFHVCNFFLQV